MNKTFSILFLKYTHLIRHKSCVAITTLLLMILSIGLSAAPCTWAGEGGGSHYMPGTKGDFAMALIGPKGWYLRNDLTYIDGDIGPVTIWRRFIFTRCIRCEGFREHCRSGSNRT